MAKLSTPLTTKRQRVASFCFGQRGKLFSASWTTNDELKLHPEVLKHAGESNFDFRPVSLTV